jgi:hypothetical protein
LMYVNWITFEASTFRSYCRILVCPIKVIAKSPRPDLHSSDWLHFFSHGK